MRMLFICGREPEYVRNQIVLKALNQHANVTTITDSARRYPPRLIRLSLKFIIHLLLNGLRQPDIFFVGFYGYPLVFLVRLFSRRPIIFDAYLSTYNTLCYDRKVFDPHSFIGRLIFLLDRLAFKLSDIVLVDTRAHLDYFVRLYRLPPEKFAVLYLGCDEELFYPRKAVPSVNFQVFYYGSFLPVQGIEHIVHAARLLVDEPNIVFQIAGEGMGFTRIRALADELGCTNIGFLGWVPFAQLPDAIAQASVCLGGHFSDNDKAQNVVATKTYQFLAMAKPTIVGSNTANAEVFTHGEHVYMCTIADPRALADAILTLRNDDALRERIAWGGYTHFMQHYSTPHLSAMLGEVIRRFEHHAAGGQAETGRE